MNDEIYVSNALTPMMLSGFLSTEKEPGELSGREHEILKLLAEGYSNPGECARYARHLC